MILASALAAAIRAAVPLAWEARPGQPAPVMFDRYHGETLALAATLRGFGGEPFADGADVRLWYQTNGMGAAWWSAPATVRSNVVEAVWSPELDPGAERVSLFFGAPSNAYAAAVLRLRHSPGFAPGAMPDPESFHESDPVFAEWLSDFHESDPVFSSWLEGYTPPNTDLTPATNYASKVARDATNYTDAVALDFEDGARSVQHADNSGHSEYAVYLYDDGANTTYTASDLMRESTNAAEAVAGPMRGDIADLRTESALVYRLYQGSNVVAEVTNYNSNVHAPELRIMQLNGSNEYITVWTETNGLARTLTKANEYTDAAVSNRAAPRAWSKVTAGMGVEAPSNTTWLSTARTVIAGGLENEKHLTSGGAIWLLESNGMTADFHAQTNNTAFIDLSNADGTPIFRVEKTDSFLVGVHVDQVTVDGNALVCGVNVVANDHPLVRVKAELPDADWAKEEDGIPASLATVTWSGSVGNWTCRVQNNTGGGSIFVQMEYLQEGGTKIVNSAPMDISQGILCTDGIHKCRPVYNNGTITWEVVQ